MKRYKVICFMFVLSFFTTSANSSIITTTFASNNGQAGNMFDVVNLVGDLTITGFDLNLEPGISDIFIYAKSGTWVGFENDSSAWNLIDSKAVTSSGNDIATFFDVTDFLLGGTSTTALYITAISMTMNYTDGTGVGNVFADNGDLQILEGAGKAYPFSTTFTPRVWNGSIYYNAAPASVPEPASIALLALGLLGIGFSRKKKKTI